ncbi:hypothetical protein BVRB_037440, partial [Beta vulgaris subsp. vulgaris]
VAKETVINKTKLAGRFVSDDDHVELEDEHARLRLSGDVDIDRLVTGNCSGRSWPFAGFWRILCP